MSNTPRSLIEKRRDVVQREALRGKSTRQIEVTFAKAVEKNSFAAAELGMVNPETGKAWDHTTISRDLTYLEKQWRDDALRDRAEYKMRELAELREHRRAAWQAGELAEVRLSIKTEMELMGTSDIPGTEDKPMILKVVYADDGTDDQSPETTS